MKLLSLTNRYYISSIVLIFIVGSFLSYLILESIINKEFNEKLFAERDQFIFEWHTYEGLREVLYLNIGDQIEVFPVDEDPRIGEILKDTVMFDAYEKKNLSFRQLKFVDELDGQFYIITITKSLLPNEDLIQGIGEIMLFLIAALIIALILINRWIAYKVLQPFYYTLRAIKEFNITKPEAVRLLNTNVDEFNELNRVLDSMIVKSQKDYINLKEFTENASHEIQTPLAIIKSKAELLLQESQLSEGILNDVKHIYEAAGRLSRLKQGLSILSKIDNNQFFDSEPINLKSFLEKKINNLEELINLKELTMITSFKADPVLVLNNDLAYILITNLLNNAIKHNMKNGTIEVTLDESELIIENTGEPVNGDPELFFGRFKKGSQVTDSSGLGLALVRKICDLYSIKVRYTINSNLHRLSLSF